MLRKMLILGLPVLLFLSSAVTVIALERQRTPDWQQALDRYLDQTQMVNVQVEILGIERASLPWNFSVQMGTPVVAASDWTWQIDRLPYPPDSLRCVLIDRRPTNAEGRIGIEPKRQLLYLAHHTDAVWRVGWIVHEGPSTLLAPGVVEDLAEVGCRALSGMAES